MMPRATELDRTLERAILTVRAVQRRQDHVERSSRAAALAMMIFVLLYFPCIATVAAIAQEAGGWRWALFSVVYNTLLAWVVAFAAFHIGTLLGL